MNDIHTYNDLLEEKKRLEALLVLQKDIIRLDIVELREELRPALNMLSIVSKVTNTVSGNPLLKFGAGLAAEVLLKKTILSGSGKIAQLIAPFLAKKVSGIFKSTSGNGGNLFHRLAGFLKKDSSNGRH